VKNRVKVLKTNGQWQRFSTENILDASEDNSFGRMLIDRNGGWQQIEMVLLVLISNNTFKKMTIGTDTVYLQMLEL
jgi:hypothetical protein